MPSSRRPSRIKEPVQVYLDASDRALLDDLSQRTGLPRTEILRRGLRRLAGDELVERAPGWSFTSLVGVLGTDPGLPADLAAGHDDYLYAALQDSRSGPD